MWRSSDPVQPGSKSSLINTAFKISSVLVRKKQVYAHHIPDQNIRIRLTESETRKVNLNNFESSRPWSYLYADLVFQNSKNVYPENIPLKYWSGSETQYTNELIAFALVRAEQVSILPADGRRSDVHQAGTHRIHQPRQKQARCYRKPFSAQNFTNYLIFDIRWLYVIYHLHWLQ